MIVDRRHSVEASDGARIPSLRHRAKELLFRTICWAASREVFWTVDTLHDVEIVENTLASRALPVSLAGLRFLHLSDLHLDSLRGPDELIRRMSPLEYDFCVLTGDFANGSRAEALLSHVAKWLVSKTEVFSVLGNHDDRKSMRALEACGVVLLMNRAVPLPRTSGGIWVAGVDDPYYYQTDDIAAALDGVPGNAVTLMLAHSPQLANEAANAGCAWYLCGHTHGGHIRFGLAQAQWPARNRFVSGAWQCGSMQGYTSRGVGAYGGLARINCPPEITIHITSAG